MGFLSGSAGDIRFGKSDLSGNLSDDSDFRPFENTKVTSWTLSTTAQLLDTTTLGDYDKNSVYGLRTTSGTLRLLYYTQPGSTQNGSPATNSASWFINALARAATEQDASSLPANNITEESIPVRLRLYLQKYGVASPQSSHDFVDLDANLTNVAYGSTVGELVAVNVSFEATGQLVYSQV